ncbi:archaeal heat shock protein Hsp20 [Ferroplasma sp.]|uniref:archaeal heat shock protein Hsp20 n=1 Tax=Ferroplasma sp. TaxID=2591003 RepID=UPI00307E10A4
MNGRKDDDWGDIFNDMYDEFGLDMRKINKEMAKFWESMMKGDANSKIMGPYVYGFSYKVGPDGKPMFQEFGNVPGNKLGYKEGAQEDYREPLTDINEDKDNVYITYELPGVEKSDINLVVNESNIEMKVDKGSRKYYKNIDLNAPIDVDSVIAKFTNGVLDITIKKLNSKNGGRAVKID